VEKLIDKIAGDAHEAVGKFFKERAAEFKQAQAEPQDGVTIKMKWNNVTGMSAMRTVINAIKGDQPIGNLTDLTLPNFPLYAIYPQAYSPSVAQKNISKSIP